MNKIRGLINRFAGYFVTFGAGAVQIISAVFLSRIAFHYLSTSELKLWFVMMAVMPFISLFELGVTLVLPHQLAQINYEKNASSALITNFLTAVVAITTPVLIIALVLAKFGATLLSESDIPLIIILCIAVYLRVIGNVLQGVLYAMCDNAIEKTIRIVSSLVLTITGVICLKAGFGIYSMPTAWIFGALLSIGLAIGRQIVKWKIRIHFNSISKQKVMEMLGAAIRYIAIAVPGQFVFNATPFIIAANLPATDTISYGLNLQIIAGIGLVANTPITVATPKLAAQYRKSISDASSLLMNTLRLSGLLSVFLLTIIWINQHLILSVWTGRSMQIDSVFLAVYFFMMFVEWQQNTMSTAVMATGNFKFVIVTICSALLILLGMPLIIKRIGFVGVPLSLLAAQLITSHPYNIRLAFKTYRIKLLSYLLNLREPFFLFILICVGFIICNEFDVGALAQLFITCSLGLLVLCGVFYRNILTKSQNIQFHL
ncbi:lipopolysaccharide biosynthesis protein [Undibacterium sp. RuRC25W]|uniref:lipopolysaccharide biosynthesis protein n=1 Tax=Undibacterium sp. RuRC25W TaxID=3413047 RepID=UPI003BF1AC7D